jgi:hypothetical protein
MRYSTHIQMRSETTNDIRQWFRGAMQGLWPIAEGSLSLRKCPCIRPNCPACARGEGHSSYVLYGRQGKKRLSIYVPENLVPEVQAALENGRRLQQLMNEAGLRYVRALKRGRTDNRGKDRRTRARER